MTQVLFDVLDAPFQMEQGADRIRCEPHDASEDHSDQDAQQVACGRTHGSQCAPPQEKDRRDCLQNRITKGIRTDRTVLSRPVRDMREPQTIKKLHHRRYARYVELLRIVFEVPGATQQESSSLPADPHNILPAVVDVGVETQRTGAEPFV